MKKIFLFILLMLPVTMLGQDFTRFESPTEALVYGKSDYSSGYYGAVYLIVDFNGNYYDDQIIKIPRGMEVRRVGTVRYVTKNERTKTVPVIQIMEKQKKSKKKRKKE